MSESYDSDHFYLTDVSPKDKPWDVHKAQSQRVGSLYQGTFYDKFAGRIGNCSGLLQFGWIDDALTGEVRLKLVAARFCRVRHCPICQWRRSLMWQARFKKAAPSIDRDYPTARYLLLTLTVQNCPLGELRQTLMWMNESWKRLTHRKQFPAIGFARSTEVTRGKDGSVHPHFHALLMVQSGYFNGKNYLSQADWVALWQSCLQVNYAPVVDIRACKPRRRPPASELAADAPQSGLLAALPEVFKYTTKPEDLFSKGGECDRDWLVTLTGQLHKTRAVALGGIFRQYLSENDPEDLIGGEETEDKFDDLYLTFGWREMIERYVKQ